MKVLIPLIALALTAVAAQAQELVYSDEPTRSCVAAAGSDGERAACVGASANACMAATEGGYSTVGIGGCLSRELDYWDGRLNTAYRRLMAEARKMDAENAGYGATGILTIAEALRAMQRAWIPYRDAACDFERSKFANGTGGGPAQLSCLLQITARQAMELEAEPRL